MKTNNVDFGTSFKFKHVNSDEGSGVIYTYNKPVVIGASSKVTWHKNSRYEAGYCMYSVEEARRLVENGIWIVIPTDMKEIVGHTGPGIIYPFEEPLLDEIKAFTANSKHSVNIYNGAYEVFRSGEDMAYQCKDDETLKKVMGALKVLDGVVSE